MARTAELSPEDLRIQMDLMAMPSGLAKHGLPAILAAPFQAPAHIKMIEDVVLPELLDFSKKSYIMVNAPPRHGKSMFVQVIAAWFLMMFPTKRVIYITYGDELSTMAGKNIKQLIEMFGPRFFNVRIPKGAGDSKFNINGSSLAGLNCVGIQGGITGFGGDCFPAGTMVSTPRGDVDIAHLAQYGGTVWSYDESSGQVKESRVVAGRRIDDRHLVEVEFASGRRFRCTPDHRIWVEGRGWTRAGVVQVGAQVRALGGSDLRGVRGRFQAPGLRGGEDGPEGREGSFLHSSLRGQALQDHVPLRDLLRANREEDVEVLLPGMPISGARPSDGGVSGLWDHLSDGQLQAGVLLAPLRRRSALGQDDGSEELALHGGNQPDDHLLQDETADHRAGSWLCRLRRNARTWRREIRGASHRRGRGQQHAGELGPALPAGSPQAPQVEGDTLSLVRLVREDGYDVYDIQVEGTSCFFAEEVLVHNCIILDDVIKNAEEAGSAATKEKHVKEYDSSIRNRLEPGGTMICIATRWAEDDLPGTIKNRCETEGYAGDPWQFLTFPALAEVSEEQLDEWGESHTSEEIVELEAGWTDVLGRHAGEALWPKRYDADDLALVRGSIDPLSWGALFQQNPTTRAGGMFPPDCWQYYDETDRPEISKRCWIWDTAFTEDAGDWTVGILLGLTPEREIVLLEHERFQGAGDTVEKRLVAAAKRTGPNVPILIEQERSGSGKFVVNHFTRLLEGWIVEGVRPEGDKVERAGPLSSIVRLKQFLLPRGQEFLKAWIAEFRFFPRVKHDDQVDAAAHGADWLLAFSKTTLWSPAADFGQSGESIMQRWLDQAGVYHR